MNIICVTLTIETSPQSLPLGAACIASAIKHNPLTKNIFSSKLICVSKEDSDYINAQKKNNQANYIADKILECKNVDFVCFSVYIWNRNELEQTAKIIKEKNPDIITIAGGPEVTAAPKSFNFFDWTVAGEGEIAVPELIALLKDNKPINIQGVYSGKTKKTDTFLKNGSESLLKKNTEIENFSNNSICRATPPVLSEISSPYLDGTLDPSPFGGALWELARGCPFKCSYCYESKGEKKVQYFPMERIEKEIELFNAKKINQIFVLDPTYNANKKRALEILNLIQKKAPGMFFYFEIRSEYIDKELAKAWTKIPCSLQIGLQSADPKVLSHVHRTLDKKQFTRNISLLNEEGAIFGFDLIYGLPTDTLEGFKKSIDFALNLYPNNLETFCLSVLPGTDLMDNAINMGLIFQTEPPYNVIESDTFSKKDIEKAKKLSHACNIFYNQGRAVPWFNSVCHLFNSRPSALLYRFAIWLEENKKIASKQTKIDYNCLKHEKIQEIQLAFLQKEAFDHKKQKDFKAIESIIKFHGALSRIEADKSSKQTEILSFHPNDLATPYATDISFFSKNCKPFNCHVQFFYGKNGPSWKCQKKI